MVALPSKVFILALAILLSLAVVNSRRVPNRGNAAARRTTLSSNQNGTDEIIEVSTTSRPRPTTGRPRPPVNTTTSRPPRPSTSRPRPPRPTSRPPYPGVNPPHPSPPSRPIIDILRCLLVRFTGGSSNKDKSGSQFTLSCF